MVRHLLVDGHNGGAELIYYARLFIFRERRSFEKFNPICLNVVNNGRNSISLVIKSGEVLVELISLLQFVYFRTGL